MSDKKEKSPEIIEVLRIVEKKEWVEAKGMVVGVSWYGDVLAYPSESLKADTMEELKSKIEEGIKEGWLDDGFGFQEVKGGFFEVRTIIQRKTDEGEILMTQKYSTLTMGEIDPFTPQELLQMFLDYNFASSIY